MTRRWKDVRVADLVADGVLQIGDGYRVTNAELGPVGVPFVRGGDIGFDGGIETNTEDRIADAGRKQVQVKLSRPGDVAFITKGNVGRVGYLRPEQPTVVFAPQVAVWRSLDHAKFMPRFIYYFLKSARFQQQLDAVKTHGSMVADYVSITDQLRFSLTLPPMEEQEAITEILGVLDDKIDLNRRMNQTLEAIVQALFRSWFVDFDPVRAKAEGRQPESMDAETAALFPNRLVESDLGDTPEGWAIRRLGDILELKRGYDLPSSQRVPGAVPVVSSSGPSGWHNESKVSGPGYAFTRLAC